MLEGLKYALKSLIARIAPRIYIYLNYLQVAYNTGRISHSSS